MKICLFDSIGNLGIVIGWKKVILDSCFVFEVDREGELRIGEKVYPVVNGEVKAPQCNFIYGERRNMYFVDKDGNEFFCGSISRTGSRTVDISNEVESCLLACIDKIEKQEKDIKVLKEEISKLKNEYGVSFN